MLDFNYFEKNYKIIAADLSKQKALDADSRAMQQISFTGEIKSTVVNTLLYTNNLLCTWKIKRSDTRIFKRNNKSLASKYKANVN